MIEKLSKFQERYRNDPEFREQQKQRQRDLRKAPSFLAAEKEYRARADVRARRSKANCEYVKRDEVKPQVAKSAARYRSKPEARAKALARQRRKLGFTPGLADTLLQIQGGKCAVCGEPFNKTPHADHCHDTGVARGLLCSLCNSFEGRLRRLKLSPSEFAERLQRYLDTPPAMAARDALELAG